MKTVQAHGRCSREPQGRGLFQIGWPKVARGGFSEKVAFEPRLKSKKAQPCQEQKVELCRHRERQVPRKALVCRGGVGDTSLTCWRKRRGGDKQCS